MCIISNIYSIDYMEHIYPLYISCLIYHNYIPDHQIYHIFHLIYIIPIAKSPNTYERLDFFSEDYCYILNTKIYSWQISPMIFIITTQVGSIKIQENILTLHIIQEIQCIIAGIPSTNRRNLNFILCVSSQHSDYA